MFGRTQRVDDFNFGLREIIKHCDDEKEYLIATKDDKLTEIQGEKHYVRLTEDYIKDIEGYHLFHNHPACTEYGKTIDCAWLSYADVICMINYKAKSITSVCRHKRKIVVTTIKTRDDSIVPAYERDEIQRMTSVTTETYKKHDNQFLITVIDEGWKWFAKKFNYDYKQYVYKGRTK